MIRSLLLAMALLTLPAPAGAGGEPSCLPAERLFEVKAATGWRVEQFAVGDYGRPVFLALGPTGEVEIISLSLPGVACLLFAGRRATAPEIDPPAATVEQREG